MPHIYLSVPFCVPQASGSADASDDLSAIGEAIYTCEMNQQKVTLFSKKKRRKERRLQDSTPQEPCQHMTEHINLITAAYEPVQSVSQLHREHPILLPPDYKRRLH